MRCRRALSVRPKHWRQPGNGPSRRFNPLEKAGVSVDRPLQLPDLVGDFLANPLPIRSGDKKSQKVPPGITLA